MLGTVENPGVMVLAIKDLFSKVRKRNFDGNYVVHLSYLEVYNESVRDLLSPGRPLILREDKQVYNSFKFKSLFTHLPYKKKKRKCVIFYKHCVCVNFVFVSF